MRGRNTFKFQWKIPSFKGFESKQTENRVGQTRCLPHPVRVESGCELLFCSGFGGFDFGGGVGVLFGEAFDAASGVNQFLFAGEERVAIGADFDVEALAFDGRASLEIIAARAVDCYGVIVGVNTGFHEAPFVRVRSARLDLSQGEGLHP
jgi:hypothetical protein